MTDTKTARPYPEAKTIQVEVELPKHGPYGPTETLRYERDFPEWVHCTNPVCDSGKLLLRRPVEKALGGRKTEATQEIQCNGVEKSRGGRGNKCMTRAKVTLRATYGS